jgi:hypothetical protein
MEIVARNFVQIYRTVYNDDFVFILSVNPLRIYSFDVNETLSIPKRKNEIDIFII